MAPTPQEPVMSEEFESGPDGERVVISGISGLYPDAMNVKTLETLLYEKKNPISGTEKRWTFNHPEVRNHLGQIPVLNRFDAQFFKVHYRLSNSMDAMSRKILEQAYQAIYDAGVCPESLSGKKVGVYVGSCSSETEKACFYVPNTRTGLGIAGCNKSMFANRISYWLNAKGPSMNVDKACCSSLVALEQAYQAISRGDCEAAIVGGGHLCLHPQSTVHYSRIVAMASDGKTKSFDQNADGTANSEAVNVLFLQKAKDAKRVYAEVVKVKTEFIGIMEGETGPQYGFIRDPITMSTFMKDFYLQAKVSPQDVQYVEAFGSAQPEADKAELEAIEEVFCKGRSDPLMVGSVMSNIGYGEAASGISAITKVLLGFQRGELAANLHCENPRQDVAAIRDGRIHIVREHQRFNGALAAVNQISFAGANAHVLLRRNNKHKDSNRYKSAIPRLVVISARQDTGVKTILEDLKSRPVDPEEHALFHHIHKIKISGHLGRGYTILDTNEDGQTVCLSENASYFDDAQRPLWFVYSGMGSQWAGMGAHLMRIPVFAAAIEKCRKALEPKGVDIVHIITSTDKTIFDNILHSFVGIAAVQIGLTDVLTSVGIKPDKIIGHSVGELGCAYADGSFTVEEMILSAYSRGLVSKQTPFIRGSMAAVGIGYNQAKDLVPPEIEIACHNGPESSTISGPADKMKEFVAQLTEKGIFAKEVPCSNIAYHSRYIAEAGPGLLKYLSEVIKNPKRRSERWMSSSVPQDKWDEPVAKYSSAEYHTNNLLSPVLFEETSKLIPANAVCIEIAPHALLQAILKRSLPESVKNIPLTKRGHKDNAFMVLDAIGKLYLEGFYSEIHNLYPKVEFPVSSGTPMLSHLVEWAHNEKWMLPLYQNARHNRAAITKQIISVHDEEYKYMRGHVIRGKMSFPFAAALVAAWDTMAMYRKLKRKSISAEFHNVQFYGQPILHENQTLKLTVAVQRATGHFEVLHEDRKVASGLVKPELYETIKKFQLPFKSSEELDLSEGDIYQTLYERDYFYTGDFRTIKKANKSYTEAEISWDGNWVTYLDGILQLNALRDSHETLSQLLRIRKICIDIDEHRKLSAVAEERGEKTLVANVFDLYNMTRCGGVLMENIQFTKLPALEEESVGLKISKFIPRFKANIDTVSAIQVYLQVVAENINKNIINVLGIMNSNEELPVSESLKAVLNDIPGVAVNYEQMRREKVLLMRDQFLSEIDLVLVQDLTNDDNLCQMLYRVLRRDSFLINEEENFKEHIRPSTLFRIVSSHISNNKKLDLVKWRPTQTISASTVVTCRNPSELVLLKGTRSELPPRHKLVILASHPPVAGLKELVKQWRRETDKNQIYLIMISETNGLDQLPELDLAFSTLVNNVWGNEYFVTHQEIAKIDWGYTLRGSTVGDLNPLHWEESGEPAAGSGVVVNVHYAAINNSDAKKAAGVFPKREEQDRGFGMDFSGLTKSGQRVMGMVRSGAVSSSVVVRPEQMWPIPEHWSLEDAATVPLAYALAFYCFGIKVQLHRGCRILVHGGTGALGQAVLSIALAHSCEVFTTVSDVRKKRFLMKLFPDLQEDHIGNSRDASFGDMVRAATDNSGCNIVICNLKGEDKNVSLNCLSSCGVLMDTDLLLSRETFDFGMFYLTKERNYVPIDLSSLVTTTNVNDVKRIQLLISEGIARGYVRPLSRVTYAPDEVPRAFNLLAGSRHRGRVLLRLQDKVSVVEPRITCSPDLTHVVLCDEQSFGLQVAQRLVERGARKLCLHFTKTTNNLKLKALSWEKQGVKVHVSLVDLSSDKGIITLLTESNSLGSIEGIYVVATDASKNVDKLNTMIASLDHAARKMCPSVRYFAIVNAGACVGYQACLARSRDGLPVTHLNIPALRKWDSVNETDESALSWRGALKALERAVRSAQKSLMAHSKKLSKPTLLQQIARIADVEISEETTEHITLTELGIEMAKVPAIAAYLKDKYSIVLVDGGIQELTKQRIRDLEEVIKGSKLPEKRGLETFYTYVDPDELLATTEIALLPTLTQSAQTRSDEFDVSQNNLCIIPGLEGHHQRFQSLCERLKLTALILQPGLDHLQESQRELAERYAKILMEKACIKDNFYLLGYESGVSVALEVAGILEDYGLKGTVYCVGNTPAEFQAVVEQTLGDISSEEELQNAVARYMYQLMTGNTEGLETALLAPTWNQKIKIIVRMLLGKVAHSAQYAGNLIEAAYIRLKQARHYKAQPRQLKSKLILLHTSSVTTDISPAKELQLYSQQPVVIYELEESLSNALKDLRCSAIINQHLSSEILQAFDERNLCEEYLLNAESFMMNASDLLDDDV